jgi:type II secretory pathway component PulK
MTKEKGSILIVTLWILIILSIWAVIVSSRASTDIALAKHESENIKALYLAKAGIMKMIAELNKDTNAYDSLNEDWCRTNDNPKEFKFGGGAVFYGASDEESRLNLNSPTLQKEYLIRLGMDETISQRVLDYKVKKGDKGFEFMEELFLIDDMTSEIYSKIKDYVTIYRGNDAKVNINTSSEEMLDIILGNDTQIIDKILVYRKGLDAKEGTEDDGIFTDDNFSLVFENFGVTPDNVGNYQSLLSVKSSFFRIWAEASFSEDKKIIKKITSAVDRSGKIYYWKED